ENPTPRTAGHRAIAVAIALQIRCGVHHAAGLAAGVEAAGRLNVLALIEATRLTGVARNAIEYARLANQAIGGVHVAVAFAFIRRCMRYAARVDVPLAHVAAAGFPFDVLT